MGVSAVSTERKTLLYVEFLCTIQFLLIESHVTGTRETIERFPASKGAKDGQYVSSKRSKVDSRDP
jgi:hypothetical protein